MIHFAHKRGKMKKRFVWIGVAVFLSLFAAAMGAVIHPGFAIGQLQDYVAQKTGRTLVVKGGATLMFTPKLGVRLEDVSISNPEGMDGVFVNASRVDMPIRYSDLFRRKLKIKYISLVDPHFNFLIDSQGKSSWTATGSSKGDPVSPSERASTPNEPLGIAIENGTASYLDERSGQAFSIESTTGTMDIGDGGEVDLTATAALNSQFAKIEAHLQSLQRVAEDGSPADIAIRAPALNLNFSGRLGTRNSLSLVGKVEATSADLRVLAKWLGNTVGGTQGLQKFSLDAAVDSSGTVFNLTKASIGLDGMVASGALSADFSNKIPQISGDLSTDLLNLDPYLVISKTSPPTPSSADDGWSVAPYKFKALNGVEGELSISAFLVKWKNAEWGPVDISNRLKAGMLISSFRDAKLYGGTGSATITLDGGQDIPHLKLDFDGHGLRGEKFFTQLAGLDWLDGATSLKASLESSGHHQQEMMSNLQGTFSIAVSKGDIRGIDIVDSVAKVGNEILKGWTDAPEKLTAFDSASASFAIKDGIAHATDITLESPQVSMRGAGDVDMLRRALDLKFDPQLTTGDGATHLPVQIVVKGPWVSPKIYPDINGVLDNPDAAYQALQDMGLPEVSGDDVKKLEKKGKKILKKIFGN
jgi:AsmA protein